MKWDRWIFRGQEDSEWPLMTAIERLTVERWEHDYNELPKIEEGLIRTFVRHFHNYSHYIPCEKDKIEWLSIMQHYGTATRLLDCTYSFYVALFFALDSIIQSRNSKKIKFSAIWAFDSKWLYKYCRKKLSRNEKQQYNFTKYEDVTTDVKKDNYFLFNRKRKIPSVYPVNAFKRNKRLTIQQGVFLSPGDIKRSFILNLKTVAEGDEPQKHLFYIRLPNDKKFLESAIRELNRMNMNSATLFPGLDGFARYLNKFVIMSELIKV